MIEERFKAMVPQIEQSVRIITEMGIKIVEMRDRYVRIMLPLEPNVNHIRTVYAGSLYTLAEFTGGVVMSASVERSVYFPIVKEVSIRYRRPATTDMYCEAALSVEQVEEMLENVESKGKADYHLELELKDEKGETCCLVQGTWQMRKRPTAKS